MIGMSSNAASDMNSPRILFESRNSSRTANNNTLLTSLPESSAVTDFHRPGRRARIESLSDTVFTFPIGQKNSSIKVPAAQKIVRMRRTHSVDDFTDAAVKPDERTLPTGHRRTNSIQGYEVLQKTQRNHESQPQNLRHSFPKQTTLINNQGGPPSQEHDLPLHDTQVIKTRFDPPVEEEPERRKSVETRSTCESSINDIMSPLETSILQGPHSPVASRRTLFRDQPSQMGFSSVWDLDRVDFAYEEKQSCCGTSKTDMLLWSILLMMGLGIGGYLAYLYVPRNEAISDVKSVILDAKDSPEVYLPAKITSIEPPPSDIEARCSASNLPGALSVCLSACLPSACCYPEYTDESCSETAECSLYKPHCDIFFDAWDLGTEGVLREVTDEMMATCESNSSDATEQSNPIVRKRLRMHLGQESSHNIALTKCQDYCTAAKCCDAAVIGDPDSSGLFLSPRGVYTNASTGEHVVTNCQASNDKNIELCSKYELLCRSDGLDHGPTTTPSTSPRAMPSASVSPSKSISPTSAPSAPNLLSSANVQNVRESCATGKAQFLIRTGDRATRSKCFQACSKGACCFAEELGFVFMNSCYAENEEECSQIASCLILQDASVQDENGDTVEIEVAVNSTATHDE